MICLNILTNLNVLITIPLQYGVVSGSSYAWTISIYISKNSKQIKALV